MTTAGRPVMDLPYLAAARPRSDAEPGPVGVSVIVASRDPRWIATAAPRVAAMLYPGRTFGRVLHVEDVEPYPEPKDWKHGAKGAPWPAEWSAVTVEETRPCPIP